MELSATMWHRATIQSRKQLSPTVTGLTLKLHDTTSAAFTFVPGQWVDFQPHPTTTSWKPNKDGSKTIGGYSITSIPKSLPYIDLAVQTSRHPVAEWVTRHASVNDSVNLRVGGSFTYATSVGSTDNTVETTDDDGSSNEKPKKQRLLFVAGGVGINPLFSMIKQWYVEQTENGRNTQSKAVLLYSGRKEESLLFVNELNEMVGELSDHFRVVLTTTAPAADVGVAASSLRNDTVYNQNDNIIVKKGRFDRDMIKDAVCWINAVDNVDIHDDERKLEDKDDDMMVDLVYVCGPPGMPEDIQRLLIPSESNQMRFMRSSDDVHFEKWW
eukprot:scaffold144_cov159-Skeletonema_menzelii.AAC.3